MTLQQRERPVIVCLCGSTRFSEAFRLGATSRAMRGAQCGRLYREIDASENRRCAPAGETGVLVGVRAVSG